MLRGFSFNTLLGTQRSGGGSHLPKCDCGCVPNVMSLHDQAKERARRREASARKPTVGEVLLQREKAFALQQQQQQSASTGGAADNMLVAECDEDDEDDDDPRALAYAKGEAGERATAAVRQQAAAVTLPAVLPTAPMAAMLISEQPTHGAGACGTLGVLSGSADYDARATPTATLRVAGGEGVERSATASTRARGLT